MKSITYLKSRKLILIIFLGLQNFHSIDTAIVIPNATKTLQSTIVLPSFATSKYINTDDIRISNSNITNNLKISNTNIPATAAPVAVAVSAASAASAPASIRTTIITTNINNNTNSIENVTIDYKKTDDDDDDDDIIEKNRYKRNSWNNNNNNNNNDNYNNYNNNKNLNTNFFWEENEENFDNSNDSRSNGSSSGSSGGDGGGDSDSNKNKNYYYEEQNPLIVMQSESGPITFTDYTGTVKTLPDDDDDNHRSYNTNEYNDSRNKYFMTTPSSGINDLSSKEMDEYDANYQNDDVDYYDKRNNDYDEIEHKNENDYKNPIENLSSYMEKAKNLWDIFSALNTAWSSLSNQPTDEKDEKGEKGIKYKINDQKSDNKIQYDDRSKRNLNMESSTEIAVDEGRYIKGDPLKGYYDFVITEGSYKFWAAFQFATAILIIYSTFAAIYYSKVNPLVGDYDYVDYLGGRSLSNDDSDFVDLPYSESQPKLSSSSSSSSGLLNTIDNNNKISSSSSSSYLSSILNDVVGSGSSGDWIPKMGHTLKFILEAIDKIPQ